MNVDNEALEARIARKVVNFQMTDKPTRRWFQFRLRTLMVFVTLCAVA